MKIINISYHDYPFTFTECPMDSMNLTDTTSSVCA